MSVNNFISDSASRKNLEAVIEAFKLEIISSSITPLRDGKILEMIMDLTKQETDQLQKYISDLAQLIPNMRLWGSVDLNDLDILGTDDWDYSYGLKPCRLVVFSNDVNVGFIDIFTDNSLHQLTQVFTTHYTFKDGELQKNSHIDTNINTYFRSMPTSPSSTLVRTEGYELNKWGPWQEKMPSLASETSPGVMSAADKKKLNNLTEGSNNYVLPAATDSTLGGVKSKATGKTTGRDYNVEVNPDGTMKVNVPWEDPSYQEASKQKSGLMSADDKQKLDLINSNNLVEVISFKQLETLDPTPLLQLDGNNMPYIYLVVDENGDDVLGVAEIMSYSKVEQSDCCVIVFTTCLAFEDGVIFPGGRHVNNNVGRYQKNYVNGKWGKWVKIEPDLATDNKAGLMSAADKQKLDRIQPEVVVLKAEADVEDLENLMDMQSMRLERNSLFDMHKCMEGSQVAFIYFYTLRKKLMLPLVMDMKDAQSGQGYFYFVHDGKEFKFFVSSNYYEKDVPVDSFYPIPEATHDSSGLLDPDDKLKLDALNFDTATDRKNGFMSSLDKASLDVLSGSFGIMLLDDLLLMSEEEARKIIAGEKPSRVAVYDYDDSEMVFLAGVADFFTDNNRHQLTVLFHTHYNLNDGELQKNAHVDFFVQTYYASMPLTNSSMLVRVDGCKIYEWSKWRRYIPGMKDYMSRNDNVVYGVCNGEWVDICHAGYDIVMKKQASAASLTLKSLEEGRLVLNGANEDMIAEMRELMGPERFDELAAKSVQTMELKPTPSIEEQIEAAKRAYDDRKAAMQKDETGYMKVENAEDVSSADVEPKNREQS